MELRQGHAPDVSCHPLRKLMVLILGMVHGLGLDVDASNLLYGGFQTNGAHVCGSKPSAQWFIGYMTDAYQDLVGIRGNDEAPVLIANTFIYYSRA